MPDIETLDLSVKSYATIKRMGINTTEELKDRIEDVLLHTQKAGEEALEKLNAFSVVSTEQRKQAFELHYRIISSADTAQSALWDMCKNLKEMRDSKLYKALGYKNFEDYCENEVGFNRKQAHKYISIVEKVNLENVHLSGQIGVTKLALLATVSESEQQEISERVNLEETTVKQLKAEIDKLKTHNRDLGAAKDKAVAALTPLEDELRQLKSATDVLRTHLSEAESQTRTAKQELDTERARLNKTARDLQEAREANKELIKENNQLIDENEELRSRPVDVAVVDNSAENDRKLSEVIRSLERENIRRNEEMDRQYIEDRRQLEADKQREINAIRKEYEQKLAEQSKAESMNKIVQKFEAYSLSLYETFESLLQFVESQKKTSFFDTFCKKTETMLDTFSEMWEEI